MTYRPAHRIHPQRLTVSPTPVRGPIRLPRSRASVAVNSQPDSAAL